MSSSSCPFGHCFDGWISQQRRDLEKLVRAQGEEDAALTFRALAQKTLQHFEEYNQRRSCLGREDALWSFSSQWCTTFENALLWMGGCRATLPVQLVYTLCGMELKAHMDEFLDGVRTGHLGEISPRQLMRVTELHSSTVKEEEELSARLARLQEELGDNDLFLDLDSPDEKAAFEYGNGTPNENGGAPYARIMDDYTRALAELMEEADQLRMKVMKEMVDVLTPEQAVSFLVAAKTLYLSVREWGERKFMDQQGL